jgi:ABC-2 type transport system permease protein
MRGDNDMRGLLRLTLVELKLFLRDPFATAFAIFFPLVMLLLLAAVFGQEGEQETDIFRDVPGDDYYVASSVAIVAAAIGVLTLPMHLASYREQGVLRRFRASSVSILALFVSQLAVGMVIATSGSVLMVGISTPLFDTQLPKDVVGVLVAFLLATACFTAIGFILGSFLPTSRAAQGVGLVLFFTMWMTSGTGPTRSILPKTAQDIGLLTPLTPVVLTIQDPWFGYGWNPEMLGIVAAVTVVAAVAGVVRFRWS